MSDKMTDEKAITLLKEIENDYGEPIEMAIDALKERAERKKGKWEIYVISMLDGEGCKCSECEFEGAPYWHFCPNCGVEIEGVDE